MVLRIHAYAPGYVYDNSNLFDSSDFDTMTAGLTLSGMSPDATSVGGTAVQQVTPSAGMSNGALGVALTESLQNLNTAICSLAMCPGVGDGGCISVYTQKSAILTGVANSYGEYRFMPGNSPGYEFMQAVGPSLKSNGFNNLGVLSALANTLNQYSDSIGQGGTPNINIQFFRT
jgi:hypothetical protein